jgi:hypothetical protein
LLFDSPNHTPMKYMNREKYMNNTHTPYET